MSEKKPKLYPSRIANKEIPPAAERALAEAELRRGARKSKTTRKEIEGPSGLEPTRYGDWERKGIASDF